MTFIPFYIKPIWADASVLFPWKNTPIRPECYVYTEKITTCQKIISIEIVHIKRNNLKFCIKDFFIDAQKNKHVIKFFFLILKNYHEAFLIIWVRCMADEKKLKQTKDLNEWMEAATPNVCVIAHQKQIETANFM